MEKRLQAGLLIDLSLHERRRIDGHFAAGVVMYDGESVAGFGDNLYAGSVC
jgi:hypothetical protein